MMVITIVCECKFMTGYRTFHLKNNIASPWRTSKVEFCILALLYMKVCE